MFEVPLAFFKLTGKFSLLLLKKSALVLGCDSTTLLGGILVFGAVCTTTYFLGPCTFTMCSDLLTYTASGFDSLSQSVDAELPHSFALRARERIL